MKKKFDESDSLYPHCSAAHWKEKRAGIVECFGGISGCAPDAILGSASRYSPRAGVGVNA